MLPTLRSRVYFITLLTCLLVAVAALRLWQGSSAPDASRFPVAGAPSDRSRQAPLPALDPPVDVRQIPYDSVSSRHSGPGVIVTLPRPGNTLPQRFRMLDSEGGEIVAQLVRHKAGAGGADVWTGAFEDEPDTIFSLAIVGDSVDGYGISEKHGELQLTGTTDGDLKLEKLELDGGFCQTTPAAHFGDDAPLETNGDTSLASAGFAQTIDILVVYTPLTLQEAGTVSAITAKANAMVNALNNYLSISSIDVNINLLGVAPVTHAGAGATSDGTTSTLWSRLKNTSDGQMDEAHTLRDSYGADLLCVFGVCSDYGVASVGGPWSAADFSTANGVMPHEIGHNLGCGHNDSGTGQTNLMGVYSYSYAHYVDFPPLKGTLMTYIGSKTGRFSNPDVMWDGYPSGTATRDHARTITTFATTVAGWRSSNSAPTITPIADLTVNVGTPTGALAFTVADDTTPAASLTVTGTSGNTSLVPNANINFGGSGANRTVNITPASGQVGSATITLLVDDGSLTGSTSFTLTVLPAGAVAGILYSDLADSAPRRVDGSAPSILASTASDITLYAGRGGTGGTVDRCVVFPFLLPQLGATSTPFNTATLSFNLESNDFSPTVCNLDLYGLGVRATPTVLADDYYSETNDPDPTSGTTRLQDNLCTKDTAAGLISSSGGGNTALVNYLNTQYAGGANAGKYVFLRLSKDAANGTNSKKFLVTSADGAGSNTAISPQISYSAVPGNSAPTLSDVTDRGIAVNTSTGAIPFTISDSQTAPADLTLSKSSSNPALVPTGNIVFGGSGASRSVTVTPVANQLGTSTISVTVGDGSLTATDTFVLTVTGNGIETWRFTHFATAANTGTAADSFDSNNDGENNLLEFATGQNPNAATWVSTPVRLIGNTIEFRYTRCNTASADGLTFTVEWSDALLNTSWSTAGVTEINDPGNPGDSDVENRLASVPAGTSGARFIRLRVIRP